METRSAMFWQFSFISYLVYGLTALLLLLLLWPFLRAQFRRHAALFAYLASTLVFLGTQIARYVAVVLDSQAEAQAFALGSGLFAGVAWWAQAALLPLSVGGRGRGPRVASVAQAALGLGGVALLVGATWPSNPLFRAFAGAEFVLEVFFLSQFAHFLVFDHQASTGWQRGARWALAGLSVALAGVLVLGWQGPAQPSVLGPLAEYLVVALLGGALAFSAGLVFRFGKVSRVVGQVLVFAAALVLVLLAYLVASALLADLAPPGPIRRAVEFALIALLLLLGGWGLWRFRRQWLQLAWLGTGPRRQQQFLALLGRIPRYTHSDELVRDVAEELRAYLGTPQVEFWLPNEPTHGAPEGPEAKPQPAIANATPMLARLAQESPAIPGVDQLARLLDGRARFWASRVEVSDTELPPPVALALKRVGTQLLFPIRFSDQSVGLLAIGGRSSGIFNLEELERLERVVQQTQLTLDILRLLEKEKELVQETMEANMTALRSQINPHFLFNTLNTISALVHDAPDEAEKAVEKLAYIFRHTLKFSADNFVPLETELKLVRNYLDIEQMRFGKRLAVKIEAPPATLGTPIPTLVLQTLVENCIKHGIAKITHAGRVEITVEQVGTEVHIAVFDNGPGIDLSRLDKSTGLNNVRSRLEKLYNTRDRIQFVNTGNGTLVKLAVPGK
jgi:signal transduction histidine kinase